MRNFRNKSFHFIFFARLPKITLVLCQSVTVPRTKDLSSQTLHATLQTSLSPPFSPFDSSLASATKRRKMSVCKTYRDRKFHGRSWVPSSDLARDSSLTQLARLKERHDSVPLKNLFTDFPKIFRQPGWRNLPIPRN